MWSLPSNSYHLHAQSTVSATNSAVLEEKKKKKSLASTGEAVSLFIAIDSVVRRNKTSLSNDGSKLSDRLLESAVSKSSAVSVLDQLLSADNTNKNQTKNEFKKNNNNDPWALDQLLKDDQMLVEPMPTWKKYARIILPHIGLILLSFFYVISGAFIFYHIERPNEIAVQKKSLELIDKEESWMLKNLWQIVNDNTTTKETAEHIALQHVDNVSRLLFDAFDTHYLSISHLRFNSLSKNFNENNLRNNNEYSWTITTAIFFTTTLLTTIGYGNLVPVTATGRMFCIFYALFGVPLILITVADIGKFLSEKIIWLYGLYTQTKKRIREKMHLKQKCLLIPKKKHRTPIVLLPQQQNAASLRLNSITDENITATTSMLGSENNSNIDDDINNDSSQTDNENEEEKHKMHSQLQELGIENYVSIPIALIAAILLGYMTIGAVLLANWENWCFFEGFYFSFITMTTVGFGDIVPIKQQFFFFDLFYIIVGLAITTMCIDLVGIEYIEKIHYFGRAISGARFALVNVGGKMVRVPDLVRCAYVLHQKYGQKKDSLRPLLVKGAYTPKDLALIRFIDYGTLASVESLTSLISTKLSSLINQQCKSNESKSKESSIV